MVRPPQFLLVPNRNEQGTFQNGRSLGNEPARCGLLVQVPRMKFVSTKAPAGRSRSWGFLFGRRFLSYVNDAGSPIIKDAIGAEPPDRESRVDRRTACLHQADAFREKAIADPEHHDQWIDEAINGWNGPWKRAVAPSSRSKPAMWRTWQARSGSRGSAELDHAPMRRAGVFAITAAIVPGT